jgi:hypothetical protein
MLIYFWSSWYETMFEDEHTENSVGDRLVSEFSNKDNARCRSGGTCS